jgi:hypothetical protein
MIEGFYCHLMTVVSEFFLLVIFCCKVIVAASYADQYRQYGKK